ncbi:MAG: AEC family transporter [Alphaproteobacteria bacterium]|nr:AEC family transporter [Alphaproteobacteria bacterium]
MEPIFWQILPVVIIVGLGYAAVRFDFVSQAANEGITRFVFAIALPALIFRTLASSNVEGNLQFIWKILTGYYGGALAVMLLGIVVAKFLFNKGRAEQHILAVGASHSNLILLGVPAVLILMGNRYAMPLLLVVGLHGMIMAILLTLVSRIRAGQAGELPSALWQTVLNQAKNPIFIALVASVLYSVFDLPKLPGTADTVLRILGNAVLPASLFGLGGMMVRYRFAGQMPEAAAVSALKLVAHPLIVFLIANQALGLNNWAWVAAMLAAMPVGFNMHNMASRSQNGGALASTATALSTVLAVVTVIAFLYYRSN